MASDRQCFVEWKEQFVSKERGKRVVHYYLKDITGESILAVIGTERSVRHMFYVVAEEFLKVSGAESSVNAGYRWRSRREVVNWLTSMLSKKHRQGDRSKSPKGDGMSGLSAGYQSHFARNWKVLTSDIVWSGISWMCGKQLKHFPAFSRNGITIAVHSFVFVMAEEENRHLAYLEDMYEDRKCHKKVKVRWFHHNQEVQGVVALRNPHEKEVFITPYAQVISVECIDGPAFVLSREHYEKCVAILPQNLLARVHFCCRQFKSNRVKPFKLSKLRGYSDQPIFACMESDILEDEEVCPGDNVNMGAKRTRSSRGVQMISCEPSSKKMKYDLLTRKLFSSKYVECQPWRAPVKANEKIELLCQDSGIRGCWFQCTVLQVSRKQIKVRYNDLKDEDGCGNLEEWVSASRLAMPDKLGMRYSGRPTIRPSVLQNETYTDFEIGSPVDAWWSDGWWEGVVTGISESEDGDMQVYVPSETLLLKLHKKDVRVSRDWAGDHWVDIEANPNILSLISPKTKVAFPSTIMEDVEPNGFSIPRDETLTVPRGDIVEDGKPENTDIGNDEKTPLTEYKSKEANTIIAEEKYSKESLDPVSLPDELDKEEEDEGKGDDVVKDCKRGVIEVELAVSDPKCETNPMEVAA